MDEKHLLETAGIGADDWEKTPVSVRKLVVQLSGKIEQLEQHLKELQGANEQLEEKVNRNSKNSHSPPASDSPNVENTKKKKPAGKKRGGQPGHPGHSRPLYPVEEGVSDSESEAIIYCDSKSSGLASLYQRNLKHYGKSLSIQESIKLQRLDNYIQENKIVHINLLKIDIEGHELVAFNGLGNYLNANFIDAIQFEYGGANLDSHTSLMEIFDLLNNSGFNLYKVMPNYLERREYRPGMENFQYSNYVALSSDFEKNLNL